MKKVLFLLSALLIAGISHSQDLTNEQIVHKLSIDRINRTIREYIAIPKDGINAEIKIAICAEFIKDLPDGDNFQEAKLSLLDEFNKSTDTEKDILLLSLVDGWMDFFASRMVSIRTTASNSCIPMVRMA